MHLVKPLALVCLLALSAEAARAGLEDGDRLPDNAGQIKATDHGVVCDGVTNDAPAIQAAIQFAASQTRHLVQLPQGICVVSGLAADSAGFGLIEWRTSLTQTGIDGTQYPRWVHQMQLVGAGKDRTVLRVPNNHALMQDANKPVAVLYLASTQVIPEDPDSRRAIGSGNKAFHVGASHMRIECGTGNPGCVGVDAIANNQGFLADLELVGGGSGYAGIRAERYGNGPMQIRDVSISGFTHCGRFGELDFSTVLSRVYCSSAVDGFLITNHSMIFVDPSFVTASASGSFTRGVGTPTAVMVQGGLLSGPAGSRAAVAGSGSVMLSNVRTLGFDQAAVGSPVISTATEQMTAFFATQATQSAVAFTAPLYMPEWPRFPTPFWSGNPADWANPRDGGGDDTGMSFSTTAVQSAMNSGKPIVVLGGRSWRTNGTITVPCTVKTIDFAAATFDASGAQKQLEIVGDCEEHLTIMRGWTHNTGGSGIFQNSSRPLLLRDYSCGSGCTGLTMRANRPGPIYLQDVGTTMTVPPQGRAYAEQLNLEYGAGSLGVQIINNGGRLFIRGGKSERTTPVIVTQNAGCTVLLGGLAYATSNPPEEGVNTPMFRVVDSVFTGFVPQTVYDSNRRFPVIVEETRAGVVSRLLFGALTGRGLGTAATPLRAGEACSN